VLEGKKN